MKKELPCTVNPRYRGFIEYVINRHELTEPQDFRRTGIYIDDASSQWGMILLIGNLLRHFSSICLGYKNYRWLAVEIVDSIRSGKEIVIAENGENITVHIK